MKKCFIASLMFIGIFFLNGCDEKSKDQKKNNVIEINKSEDLLFDETDIEMKEEMKIINEKSNIKSKMNSAWLSVFTCLDNNKTILSGNGGDPICEIDENFNNPNNERSVWPVILDVCGPKEIDTKWVVKNGGTENWDFVVECNNFSNCDGPKNAICNKDGCMFSGDCK